MVCENNKSCSEDLISRVEGYVKNSYSVQTEDNVTTVSYTTKEPLIENKFLNILALSAILVGSMIVGLVLGLITGAKIGKIFGATGELIGLFVGGLIGVLAGVLV
jgi:predicted lipid-binding transport protein (Tim44 family)